MDAQPSFAQPLAAKTYLLREFTRPAYLQYVAVNGLTVEFDPQLDKALQFNAEQRAAFRIKHPHVTGRWVLLGAEVSRIAAHGGANG